jgi:hypothetical protein
LAPPPDGGGDAVNDKRRKLRLVLGALSLGLGLPIVLALVLNLMRPDLVAPMLDHQFGYLLVLAESVLCVGATGLYLVATLVRFQTRTPRVLISIAAALFCTLPALAGILFGPIVFALMYGRAG